MSKLSLEAYEASARYLRIANVAVKNAQEENRRLGIPNCYSINGTIVSDQELAVLTKKRESFLIKITNFFKIKLK
jgi:hypothetical protein